ncbi:MAG: DUF1697 domain-containing protein [Anaerolineae bacterium]|nr:DUF1697 domain-containing protein [Anaerolineae bacterium]
MRYIAFLRAINVGGHNVKMDRLQVLFESCGLLKVETFITSGNVIFETEQQEKRRDLEMRIENVLQRELGYEVATFLRTPGEVTRISLRQPFSTALFESARAFNVGFLTDEADAGQVEKIIKLSSDVDAFTVEGREFYWLCQQKQSESKFSANLFERAIKTKTTLRGINTLVRLAAKYPARDEN